MLPLVRAWFPACLTLLATLGASPSAPAQEPNGAALPAAPAETRGDGAYNAVEGQTTIVSIKRFGTRVNKGELVCELETFAPRNRVAKQEIATKAADALYQNEKRDREIAELSVIEYVDGIYTPQLKNVEREISLAESELKKAEGALVSMKRLFEKGLGPKSRVEAAELEVLNAKLTLEKAQRKKLTLEKYTKEKKVRQLQSQVEKARSEELARQADLGREQALLDHLKKQIDQCKVAAPSSGTVHFAPPIEEGAEVSRGQLLFRVIPEDEPKAAAK